MSSHAEPRLSITEQLAHSTVRIETDVGTGTGFFFRFAFKHDTFVPAIVTNKHVVEGAALGRFLMTRTNDDGTPKLTSHEAFEFNGFESMWAPHPEADVDLCAMPIAPILNQASNRSIGLFYKAIDQSLLPSTEELDDLNPVEDITMVGYPNGLWDEIHNMPVFRRGITATHPKLGSSSILVGDRLFRGDLAILRG